MVASFPSPAGPVTLSRCARACVGTPHSQHSKAIPAFQRFTSSIHCSTARSKSDFIINPGRSSIACSFLLPSSFLPPSFLLPSSFVGWLVGPAVIVVTASSSFVIVSWLSELEASSGDGSIGRRTSEVVFGVAMGGRRRRPSSSLFVCVSVISRLN